MAAEGIGSAGSAGASGGSAGGSGGGGSPGSPGASPSGASGGGGAPAPQTGSGGSPQPSSGVPAGTPGAAPPAWTPNWKFRASDKDHEIPEWMRGSVTDAEQEKSLRELHEKAYGLDGVKARFTQTQEQMKKIMPQYQRLEAGKTELQNHYRRGDMDSFFGALGIPQEKILQWAVKKAQLSQLPPEQRQVHEAQSQAERRAYALEQQVQQMQTTQAQTSVRERQMGLQVELARPEVSSLVERFNTMAGRPNAFVEEVIAAGEAAFTRNGTDLTPAQAVQAVMNRFKGFLQSQPTQPAAPGLIPPEGSSGAGAPQGGFATKPANQGQRGTLPNVGGKSGSPVGGNPKMKSIADIVKARKEKFGA